MTLRNRPALFGTVIVLSLTVVGCATKKDVREAIAPVQDQASKTETHVGSLQKQTDENKQSIGDLDRQVATADEKATDAGKKAAEAADAARRPMPLPRKLLSALIQPTALLSRRKPNWTPRFRTWITTSW